MKTEKQKKRHKQDDQEEYTCDHKQDKHPEHLFGAKKKDLHIKTRHNKILATHMQDKAGNNKYDRQDIADAFEASPTKTHEHDHHKTRTSNTKTQ